MPKQKSLRESELPVDVVPPWEVAGGSVTPLKVVSPPPVSQPPAELSQEVVDAFLAEYVKDFDTKNAALRTEFIHPEFAGSFNNSMLEALKVLDTPYGQWKIDQIMNGLDSKAPVKRRYIVRKLLTEGNNPNNNSGDRQRALNSAADLQGQRVIKSEVDVKDIRPTINLTANKPKEIADVG